MCDDKKQNIINKLDELRPLGIFRINPKNAVLDSDIKYVEKELQYKLPEDYVWFLKEFGYLDVLISDLGLPYHIDGVFGSDDKDYTCFLDESKLPSEVKGFVNLKDFVSINTTFSDNIILLNIRSDKVLIFDANFQIEESMPFLDYLYSIVSDLYSLRNADSFDFLGPDEIHSVPMILFNVFVGISDLKFDKLLGTLESNTHLTNFMDFFNIGICDGHDRGVLVRYPGSLSDLLQKLISKKSLKLAIPQSICNDYTGIDFIYFIPVNRFEDNISNCDYEQDSLNIRYIGAYYAMLTD